MLHNGQLASQMNPLVKEIKKITGKKMKTDADFARIAELEFKGSLYCVKKGNKTVTILPPEGLLATVIAGAKKSKSGPKAKAGIFIDEPAILKTTQENTDPDSLWNNGESEFVDERMVVVNRGRVTRTRPIFKQWSSDVEIFYNDEVVNKTDVIDWMRTAGREIGCFENRPTYGRFEVEEI